MVTHEDLAVLRDRIIKLEGQVAFLYRHLNVTFVPEAGPADDPRILEQLRQGDLMAAIKVYREIHKVDLHAARQAVEEIKGRLGL
jgi:hypothetical protein